MCVCVRVRACMRVCVFMHACTYVCVYKLIVFVCAVRDLALLLVNYLHTSWPEQVLNITYYILQCIKECEI